MRYWILTFVMVAVGVFAQASAAHACSCGRPAGPPCALGEDDVVFVGTVQSVFEDPQAEGPFGVRRFLFTVSEPFAGVAGPELEVRSDMTSCGVEFAKGGSYLVSAGRGQDGTVRVSACSYTTEAAAARTEIEILRTLRSGGTMPRLYGDVTEFREPQEHNRPTDPELYRQLQNVRVTAAGAGVFRETVTDAQGRFAFDDLPKGQYRVAIRVLRPKRVLPYSQGFHQASDDPAAVMLQDCPARVHFTVSEWKELTSNLPPLVDRQHCDTESQRPSVASDVAATIKFDNGRSTPVRIYWLDFAGRRVLYQTIAAGQTLYQPTFQSHRWVVATEDDQCVGVYEPIGTRAIVEIGDSSG
jgi:von Hippel-Lindau disease tumor supressor